MDAPRRDAVKPALLVSEISFIPTAFPTRIDQATEIPRTAIKEIDARLIAIW